jgi:hypothetical protein
LSAAAAPAPAARAAEVGRHTRARLEPQLSFGHHGLAGVKTLFDHHVLIDAPDVTGRCSTVESGLTTNTLPILSVCTA